MQILTAAEQREKQVVGLEEELARRRRDLEHEHTTRLAEAEATVRRLQVLSNALQLYQSDGNAQQPNTLHALYCLQSQ